ncbi:mitochondrial import inner membrane translocase subunit Tim29 [Lampris incognitus]|uniref:mitochondrial import inner membrane translocase subunit Tim29 n=1 Tax=Lampris incognitus TaxID=2546036 RepID=UPI0024B4DC46|nr:mitochondrial import inner membrane translocase subunit Tim29 [Lampris incognitus]
MAASWTAIRLCSGAAKAAAPVKVTRWERLKNSKAGVWCRSLFSDYKEACRETVVACWERPVKASIYLGLLGGAWTCFSSRPDHSSFETNLVECSNQLGVLSPWIRNGTSDKHVQNLVKLCNDGRLRHLSLGIVSLTYCADYDPDSSLYEAHCSNLSVPWRELPKRVLDVGFAGQWWILASKMKDYDINEEEFKHLPVQMQATTPPSVQEVERNEKLHKDSWLPLKMESEEEGEGKSPEEKTAV